MEYLQCVSPGAVINFAPYMLNAIYILVQLSPAQPDSIRTYLHKKSGIRFIPPIVLGHMNNCANSYAFVLFFNFLSLVPRLDVFLSESL